MLFLSKKLALGLTSLSFISNIFITSCALAEMPPVKIGASLPLTGKLAFIGVAEQAAMKIAVEDINRRRGARNRPLELVIEDNQGDAKSAVSGAQKLINVDKVEIIYSSGTHLVEAIRPIVERAGKIMLYHASTNKPAESGKLTFKDYGDAEVAGKFIAETANLRGYKKVAMLSEISDVCSIFQEGFRAKYGKAVVADFTYNPGETDFKSSLLRIKENKPDALVLCIWRDTQPVLKQIKELGMISIPTLHFHSAFLPMADTEEMRKLFEENKAFSTWYGFTVADANREQQDFISRVREVTGEPRPFIPDIAMVYDDLMFVAEALADCDDVEPIDSKCLADKLSTIDFEGLAGELCFGNDRMSLRPVFGISVIDGKWKRVPQE